MKLYENLEQKLEAAKNSTDFADYIESLKSYFEANAGKEVKRIDYDLFMQFLTTGSRKDYEAVYFYPRKRLSCSAMLYLLFKEQKYLNELCQMVWYICGEINWAIPAHLSSVKAENYRTEIDLMAAITGSQLAEIYYLLKQELPQNIKDIIEVEVSSRIFDSMKNRSFWWEKDEGNWAAVCAGHVGMAYILMAPERFLSVRERIIGAMESFLRSYEADGCCKEGVGYWNYGFGAFLEFSDLLYDSSNGKYDIRHSEKVDKIALFIQRVMLRKNIPPSFSDAKRQIEFTNQGMLSYLYNTYKGFAVPDFEFGKFDERSDANGFNSLLRRFLWWNPEIKEKVKPVETGWDYFSNAQWYINRKADFSFAAKGGHNAEPHNHNDIGSFVFATDNGQILADIGAMEYTRDNFSEKRYTILQNSSLGHSVPILGEKEQKAGKEFRAEVLSVNEDEFSLNISGAYGSDVADVLRSFKIGENDVTLTDCFKDLSVPITERFISVLPPKEENRKIYIGDCVLSAEDLPKLSSVELINRYNEPERVYIIDFPVKDEKFILKIERRS